ncbi:hypothetical protein ACUVJI_22945 (plasmid) [Vibrio parahaemolyticus]|uniref:hypothetical protein n=1 Tax=Vibrio parahaemolyticus TaxID=670 RepID=UPI0028952D1B|nr:hypothetical protein [Vibrio vulnificus]HCE3031587.1 hypothetical protein [Vibrio parahaemolyticus]HCE4626653.1 hypothetical protein [Vibrio parahaemolyticus]
MIRVLIYICFLSIGFVANAESIGSNSNSKSSIIDVRSKPDTIVEGASMLFPNATQKSIDLLSVDELDGFINSLPVNDKITIDNPHKVYTDKNNDFYHQTYIQSERKGSLLEHLSLAFYGVLTAVAISLFVYILFFRGWEYVFSNDHEGDDETEDVKSDSVKIIINLFIIIALIAPIPSWETNVLSILMITVIIFMALSASFFSSWLYSALYTGSGMLSPNLDQAKGIEKSYYESMHLTIEDVVLSRIINDAHLDSELRKKWPQGQPASNEALVGLAQLQKKAADALPESSRINVNENCLISSRDYVQKAKIAECRWVLDSTEYGADISNARLNIEFSPKLIDKKSLTATERYLHEDLKGTFEDAVNALDDYKRSVICPRVHGQRVSISELEYSLFCSRKNGAGELIDGFYGYESNDGVWFDAVDDYSYDEKGDVIIPEIVKLSLMIKAAAQKLIEIESNSNIKDRSATVVYHSGLLDSSFRITDGVTQVQRELENLYQPYVNKTLHITLPNTLLSIRQEYSYSPKTIKQISDSDVPAFLEKNYPYLRNIWFEGSNKVSEDSFNLSDLSEVVLNKDPFAKRVEDFSFYVNLAVAMVTGGFVAEKLGWETTGGFISSLGSSSLMVAIVIFCTRVLSLFFTAKVVLLILCRLIKLCLFYMIKPLASILKNTFLTSEEVNKESDWALISNIKTLIIDTALLFIFAVMANFAGYVLVYYSTDIVYDVVNSTSLLDSSSVIDSVILFMLGFFLYLFIMYKCLFDAPFKILSFLGNLLDDEARDDIQKGESLSSLLKIFNVKSYI